MTGRQALAIFWIVIASLIGLAACGVADSVRLNVRSDYDTTVSEYDLAQIRTNFVVRRYFNALADLELENQFFRLAMNKGSEIDPTIITRRASERRALLSRVDILQLANLYSDLLASTIGPEANIRLNNVVYRIFVPSQFEETANLMVIRKLEEFFDMNTIIGESIRENRSAFFFGDYENYTKEIDAVFGNFFETEELLGENTLKSVDHSRVYSIIVDELGPVILKMVGSIYTDAQNGYRSRIVILEFQSKTLVRRYNSTSADNEQDRRDLLTQIELIQRKSNRLSDSGPGVLKLIEAYYSSQASLLEFAESTYEPGDLVLLRAAINRFSALARSANERL